MLRLGGWLGALALLQHAQLDRKCPVGPPTRLGAATGFGFEPRRGSERNGPKRRGSCGCWVGRMERGSGGGVKWKVFQVFQVLSIQHQEEELCPFCSLDLSLTLCVYPPPHYRSNPLIPPAAATIWPQHSLTGPDSWTGVFAAACRGAACGRSRPRGGNGGSSVFTCSQ